MSRIDACSSCNHAPLHPIISLGETPLANALVAAEARAVSQPRYSLTLVLCSHCSLVQITERVPPELLFRHYVYFSSFSDTMRQHAREYAAKLRESRSLDRNSLVVEIASNDGYLLTNFVEAGIPVLGIEPARNIAVVARERGIDTIDEFFDDKLAERLVSEGRRADVIIANNVMAHVPDVNGVVAGIAALLKRNGVFVMETPYVQDLLEHLEFDTIYHEHLFYYSLTAIDALVSRHGLAIVDIERVPIHGGSLRVSVAHRGEQPVAAAVTQLLDEERAWGVANPSAYASFAERVQTVCRELHDLIVSLRRDGKRVAAYGASAKGTTLLAAAKLGANELDFVADRSTVKQGLLTPGTLIPIVPPDRLLAEQPDYVLLLTWNFATEILAQQAEYRRRGGRFIKPIPHPEVL